MGRRRHTAYERLRIWRQARGLTAAHVAELAGIAPDKLSRLERGKQRLLVEDWERLCAALDVTPAEFFGEKC